MEEVFPSHYNSNHPIISRMNMFSCGVSLPDMLDGHIQMKDGGLLWVEAKGWTISLFVSKF
jgi:hypothetical protein